MKTFECPQEHPKGAEACDYLFRVDPFASDKELESSPIRSVGTATSLVRGQAPERNNR